MQEQLKFWKVAGLEQVWGCTICLPKGANWCQNGPRRTRCAPTSHFLIQPHCLLHTYTLCMVGSGMGREGGRKANWPCLGGVQWWGRPALVIPDIDIPELFP